MNALKAIFNKIKAAGKTICHAIALPFLDNKTGNSMQRAARWGLHALCVLGIVVCLAFLNYAMRLDVLLLTPIPALRNIWLPVVFIQIYAISWLGWWLLRMMTSRSESAEHPEISKAWTKVETTLKNASIDITETPLFLLIGKPEGGTANFLNAGQVVRSIPQTPAEDNAPFHVFAGDEAVYVCCESSSLLGRQSTMFADARRMAAERKMQSPAMRGPKAERPADPVVPAEIAVEVLDNLNGDDGDVLSGGKRSAKDLQTPYIGWNSPATDSIATATTTAQPQVASQSAPHVVAERSLELIESNIALIDENYPSVAPHSSIQLSTAATYQPEKKLVLPLLVDEILIAETTAKLKFLCTLIEKSRHPYCPLNGVVVLVPLSSSEDQKTANHTGMIIENDFQAITDVCQIDAPRIAVFCDLQETNGCVDLLDRFPEQQRHRRLGIKFPRIPTCDRESMNQMIIDGVTWLCHKMVPPLVNRLFQTERTSGGAEEAVNQSNQRLYNFMYTIRQRRANFERIVRRGFLGNRQPGELLRGCYFAATGRDPISEQGFAAGVISQMFELQNDVQWTQQAIERDTNSRRWTLFGYASVATISCVALLLIFL